jgi:hypothetical protein
MTTRDYIKIAAMLKEQKPKDDDLVKFVIWNDFVMAFAHMLQQDNPRFKLGTFLKAVRDN